MPTYVAFLRAINLGAVRKFPPAAIVAAAEGAGGTEVATHINTGNVRLRHGARSRERVEALLEAAFLADRGFEVPTVAFTPAELAAVAADADRLAAEVGEVGSHYVSLVKHQPDPDAAARLEAMSADGARVAVRGRAVHVLVAQERAYRTLTVDNARVETLLGVATNRNAKVVRAVAAKWC